MEGFFLIFYVEEKQTHQGVLLWEWLLKQAVKLGVRGGSARSPRRYTPMRGTMQPTSDTNSSR